jgi:hypothetical protein
MAYITVETINGEHEIQADDVTHRDGWVIFFSPTGSRRYNEDNLVYYDEP